jgi:putative methionine-R-sulfoxide reductase with GAF domain
MRTELERLEEQLRLSFEGEAWHGPSVLEALDGITADVASAHPIDGAHSIWDLVLHLASTYRLVLRRLTGDARPLSPAEDWPDVPAPTEANWSAAVEELRRLNAQLRRAVANFRQDQLDEPVVEHPPYPAYTQFIGTTQHDLYHAGQIVLLARAAQSGRRRAALEELGSLTDGTDRALWGRAAETIRRAGVYRWVGLYEVTASDIGALAWTGTEAPAFPRFPREKGLNGAAVARQAPVIVQDVSKDPRYLTAFATTGSEAIFPVVSAAGVIIGTIDVESDKRNAFSETDERFLRACAAALAPLWDARVAASRD